MAKEHLFVLDCLSCRRDRIRWRPCSCMQMGSSRVSRSESSSRFIRANVTAKRKSLSHQAVQAVEQRQNQICFWLDVT